MNEQPQRAKDLEEANTLRRELAEEKNRHLRTLADFDNYRKRVEREAEAGSLRGKKELVRDLLSVLDIFERVPAQIQDEEIRRGLLLVQRQLRDTLDRHGLERVESLGRPFDPAGHEGVGYVQSNTCPPGHVAEELSPGYRFGNELLRPARVLVVK
ncbi:heat shock protein GrpE [Desulfocucumis palustris]|uniref:Protein GrpE n=1 Tax=Desulfocucumis palustris TaxID=1898651 RepID=A0A2L2XD04_9FIRM|nr:nucleotide exchange factor GrpE [Desulfocucumis palustris]GBF33603.1 heat shock protein GrpE [Desulfocucumis palustris]